MEYLKWANKRIKWFSVKITKGRKSVEDKGKNKKQGQTIENSNK